MFNFSSSTFTLQIKTPSFKNDSFEGVVKTLILFLLTFISVLSFLYYWNNGLGLSYNDARSHLDIGRRVVEGLKPGLAQLGSVWLPLPHLLMIPTVWNDVMWHSGFSGAIISMVSFIVTGMLIYFFLEKIGVGFFGRIVGVFVYIANINVLYLQSTAMTELLLLATMTAGAYELMLYLKEGKINNLILSSFWIMLSTLVRYDGWFLLTVAALLIVVKTLMNRGYKEAEGVLFFFLTLSGLGVVLWFLWNLLIFDDPLYFVFGPYSARAQQTQLEQAGVLTTKGNILFSIKTYLYALAYNLYAVNVVLGVIGACLLWFDKNLKSGIKLSSLALIAPLIFNVLALYLGHSVLFIQGLSGDTWFNARYGIMMLPSFAIFIGYLVHKAFSLRYVITGLMLFVTFFAFINYDAVTIDDAKVGSSQKNVSEVSFFLTTHTGQEKGFILISAASHDAIIFSSGLQMKRFIHEGTGGYWESATTAPDRWARWIVMRTNDDNDQTFKLVKKTSGFPKYSLVDSYPFADIYELKSQYLVDLNTEPILGKQK